MTKYEIEKEIIYLLEIIKSNMDGADPLSKDLTNMANQALKDMLKANETTVNTLSSEFMTPLLNVLSIIKK